MWCPFGLAEMPALRMSAWLDYIFWHKSQHMMSEWHLWGISDYCSLQLKLLSPSLLKGSNIIQLGIWYTRAISVCYIILFPAQSADTVLPCSWISDWMERLCSHTKPRHGATFHKPNHWDCYLNLDAGFDVITEILVIIGECIIRLE